MTAPLTDSSLVIANRWYEIVEAAKDPLGLAFVFFGDQQLLPGTPSLCVEPGIKRRELAGASNMTLNVIDTIFLIYHSTLNANQQEARRDTVAFAEAIETYLHHNHLRLFAANGDQLTIHGHCTDMDPGYAAKSNNTRYNAVQMTWSSTSKTRLLA